MGTKEGGLLEQIKVLIADDHALLRQGLCRILELEKDIKVVAQAADGNEAVALAEALHPDVVLMDINMPGLNGLEATERIKEVAPESKVLVLTIHADDEYVFKVIQAGASGYVLKDVDPSNLAEAIRTVKEGHAYLRSPLLESTRGVWAAFPGQGRSRCHRGLARLGLYRGPKAPPGITGERSGTAFSVNS